MSSFNLVVIMGNITRDIELRYTPGNTAVTDITVAVNDKRKGPNGDWIDEVNFVDVTLWGRTAEIASQYLGKGSPILIEGRLKQDTWEKDGKKHSKLKVVGENMRMIGGKGEGRGGSGGGGGYERTDRGSSAPARSGGSRPQQPQREPQPEHADEYSQSAPDSYGEGGQDIPF